MLKKVSRNSSRAYVLILLLTVTLLTACADQASHPPETPVKAEATPTPKLSGRGAGDTLYILSWQAPSILNPHLTTAHKDWDPSRVTYEPLASVDKDGNLVPFLAAEIPSLENGGVAADSKSVTWKLKRDVKWSDGEPFTADDVLFTYQFIRNPDVKSTSVNAYDTVKDVEVIDDYTVKVNFKDVNPAWALPFVGTQGMILPRHKFEDYNGSNARKAPANLMPVGTGPYQVVEPGIKPQEVLFLGNELIQTNKIVFEPNPFFREEDKPFFSQVEWKGGSHVNEAARLVLQAGDVDFASNLQVDADKLAQLEAVGKGKVLSVFGPYVERILLNRTDPNKPTEDGERSSLQFPHPFFSDKKVRQAFAYAIDRDAIARLYGPAGRPTSNILVAPEAYASPNTTYEFNLEKAAALLDEAGWVDTDGDGIRDKDGIRMKVVFQTTANNPVRQQTQKIVQEGLESIGVDVELWAVDVSTFATDLYKFYADMEEYYDGNATPNPGPYMQYWTCEQIPQKANDWSGESVERWCNSYYDALQEKSTTEVDPEKSQQLFIQMNDMLIEDVVSIPLVHRAQVFGASNALVAMDPTPWDSILWNIKDWRRD